MRTLSEPGRGLKPPPFILMTDEIRRPDPVPAVRALSKGCAVILRHYTHPHRAELARELASVCAKRRLLLLVAADAALARSVGADGVHLPEWMVWRNPAAWRLARPPAWLVTASAHGPAALERALRIGADAAILSPVFSTASHPGARALGPHLFSAWRRSVALPVYALGGVNAITAKRLRAAGAAGLAGVTPRV